MKEGFIIIEWIVHIFILSLMGIMACMLFRTWIDRIDILHKVLNKTLQMPIACQVLRRDLQQADSTCIRVSSDRCIITHNLPSGIIDRRSWRIVGNRLIRSYKRYHHREKRWLKSVRNLAAEGIEKLEFIPNFNKAGDVSYVRLSWDRESTYIIVLRNGNRV